MTDPRDELRAIATRRAANAEEQQAITTALGAAALRAREAGLPIREIAELAAVNRNTVYAAMMDREAV